MPLNESLIEMLQFIGRDQGSDIFACTECGKKEYDERGTHPRDVPHKCKPSKKD